MDIDQEWEDFLLNNEELDHDEQLHHMNNSPTEMNKINGINGINNNTNNDNNNSITIPKPSALYISTQTKIIFLNTNIDLNIFWEIPIIPYHKPCDGIIKKEMIIRPQSKEELESIQQKFHGENYFEELEIIHIDNKDGKIKFKDKRKITIGLSKKNILNRRCKKKSAFDNCFVIIIRINMDNTFKEMHVKIFNTGKIEIPGIQSEVEFNIVLDKIKEYLQPYINKKIDFIHDSVVTVLINSNFNYGYFINRTKFHNILKFKYNIQSIYEPCNYPGIQNKFYYNPNQEIQKGCQITCNDPQYTTDIQKISFAVFRTGSTLISGKCDEHVINDIYQFLKKIFETEYHEIAQHYDHYNNLEETNKMKIHKKRLSKKCVHFVNCETQINDNTIDV
jgi:TATA-box binding protein (TBP) (component of TFIID and TFIIIB)